MSLEKKKGNRWIDEMVADFARSGGYDNLEGKGKPVEVG